MTTPYPVPAATEAGDHTVVAAAESPAAEASAPLTITAAPAPAPSADPSTEPSGQPSTEPSTQPSAVPSPSADQGRKGGKGGLARTGSNALIVGACALAAAGVGTAFIRRSRRHKA